MSTLAQKIQKELTKQVNLAPTESDSTQIKGYSPNNLKSVVLSQEGIALTYFTTSGSNQRQRTKVLTFPSTEQTFNELTEGKELLSFLIGSRVYSSLEEIVIIQSTGLTPLFTVPERQVQYVTNKLIPKLNRLKSVVLLKPIGLSLQDFITFYKDTLVDTTKHIYDLEEIEEPTHGTKVLVNADWWKYTNLRPQYYQLDEKGGPLHTYFTQVKAQCQEKVEIQQALNEQKELEELAGVRTEGTTPQYQKEDILRMRQDLKNAEALANVITAYLQVKPEDHDLAQLIPQIPSVAFRQKLPYSPNKILSKEVIKLTGTTLNTFLKAYSAASDELKPEETQDLVKEMLGYLVTVAIHMYLRLPSTSNQTQRVIQETLQSVFETQADEVPIITNYLATGQVPHRITKQDEKTLISLFTLQPLHQIEVPQATKQGVVLYKEIVASTDAPDPRQVNLITGLLRLQGYTGDMSSLLPLLSLNDALIRTHKVQGKYYTPTLTSIDPDTQVHEQPIDFTRVESNLRDVWQAIHTPEQLDITEDTDLLDPQGVQEEPDDQAHAEDLEASDPQGVQEEPDYQVQTEGLSTTLENTGLVEDLEDTDIVEDLELLEEREETEEDLLAAKDKVSKSLEDTWTPDKPVLRINYWLQQLAQVPTLPNQHPVVIKLQPSITSLVTRLEEHIQSYDTLETELAEDFIDTFFEELTTWSLDLSFSYYVILAKGYIDMLKTVQPLAKGAHEVPKDLQLLYTNKGEKPSVEDTYKYVRLLTILLRRRVNE